MALIFGLALCALAIAGVFVCLRRRAKAAGARSRTPLARSRCADLLLPAGDPFEPDVTCETALHALITSGRRCAPVAVRRKFIGILTLSDFAKLGERNPAFVYVAAIMTPADHMIALQPSTSGADALRSLHESGHHQLPVLSNGGTLVGFVSRASLNHRVRAPRSSRQREVRI